jgi:hypothetical protein
MLAGVLNRTGFVLRPYMEFDDRDNTYGIRVSGIINRDAD